MSLVSFMIGIGLVQYGFGLASKPVGMPFRVMIPILDAKVPLYRVMVFVIIITALSAVAAGLDVSPIELPLVINRTMAERLWSLEDAIGKIVRPNTAEGGYRARVVGIVEDVPQWGAEQPPLPEMYFPYTAEVWGPLRGRLVLRASSDPWSLVAGVRAAVREIDDQVVAIDHQTVRLKTGGLDTAAEQAKPLGYAGLAFKDASKGDAAVWHCVNPYSLICELLQHGVDVTPRKTRINCLNDFSIGFIGHCVRLRQHTLAN